MQFKMLFGLTLMAATLAPVAFSSCSDEAENQQVLVDRSGVYEEKNLISVAGLSLGTVPSQKVTLAKEANGTYTVTLGSFHHPITTEIAPYAFVKSDPMIIKHVQASTNKDGLTSLKGKVQTTVSMTLQPRKGPEVSPKEYTVAEGTVIGTIDKNGKLGLSVSFKPGSMPMPLIYVFTPAEKLQ
ncbi:MAG: calycin-like domain-containing protein [Bacteroidales bacterium]|nr:calycin-like domain-containing protein [Bacteroidales bacterium]